MSSIRVYVPQLNVQRDFIYTNLSTCLNISIFLRQLALIPPNVNIMYYANYEGSPREVLNSETNISDIVAQPLRRVVSITIEFTKGGAMSPLPPITSFGTAENKNNDVVMLDEDSSTNEESEGANVLSVAHTKNERHLPLSHKVQKAVSTFEEIDNEDISAISNPNGEDLSKQIKNPNTEEMLLNVNGIVPASANNLQGALSSSSINESDNERNDLNNATINNNSINDNENSILQSVSDYGLETHLQAGVEREAVITTRLTFLATAGYMTHLQLQIMYCNAELITPPSGYVRPSLEQIKEMFIDALTHPPGYEFHNRSRSNKNINEEEKATDDYEDDQNINQNLSVSQQNDTNVNSNADNEIEENDVNMAGYNNNTNNGREEKIKVRHYYVRPSPPDIQKDYPDELLMNSSFALMMLEAGLPDYMRDELYPLFDFSFLETSNGRQHTCLPPIPMKAYILENLWIKNESNTADAITIAENNGLMGTGERLERRNRTTSNFQLLISMIYGILLGCIFNVMVLPFVAFSGMPSSLRIGMVFGLIGNLLFSVIQSYS